MDFPMAYDACTKMKHKTYFGPEEVLTFLKLHPFLKHKVKHTSSQQIATIKIKTQFLYLLNTFMRIFYTLMMVIEMSRKLHGQTELVPSSKTSTLLRFLAGSRTNTTNCFTESYIQLHMEKA